MFALDKRCCIAQLAAEDTTPLSRSLSTEPVGKRGPESVPLECAEIDQPKTAQHTNAESRRNGNTFHSYYENIKRFSDKFEFSIRFEYTTPQALYPTPV